MGDVIEMDKIHNIFMNHDKLNEAVTILGLGIIGTSGTHYKICYMNERGVVGMKKEGHYDLNGTYASGIRLRTIFWSVQMEKETTGDYNKLVELGWEEKNGHHVSIVVKSEEEINSRLQEAVDFFEA